MTIGQIIETLKKFPAETRVVVYSYKNGYDDPVVHKCPIDIIFDVNWDGKKKKEGCDGRHDTPDTLDMTKWKNAVLIGR
jgi:hypothetical protein